MILKINLISKIKKRLLYSLNMILFSNNHKNLNNLSMNQMKIIIMLHKLSNNLKKNLSKRKKKWNIN